MTRAQEYAIESLKREFLGFYGHPENKEFKECKVEKCEFSDDIYVMLEVGYIGDEGTLQEAFCRNAMSVFVGKKGGYFKHSNSKSHYRKNYRGTTAAIIGGRIY